MTKRSGRGRKKNPEWNPGQWAAAQAFLKNEAAKEYAAQVQQHLKRGLARSTMRYSVPEWHQEMVNALGLDDPSTFLALKHEYLGRQALSPLKKRNPVVTRYKTVSEMRAAGVPDIFHRGGPNGRDNTTTMLYSSGEQRPFLSHSGHFLSTSGPDATLMHRKRIGETEGEYTVRGLYDIHGRRKNPGIAKGTRVTVRLGTPWPRDAQQIDVTGKVVRVRGSVATVDVEQSRANPGGHPNEDVAYVDVPVSALRVTNPRRGKQANPYRVEVNAHGRRKANPHTWSRGDKVLAGSVRGIVEVAESPTGAVPNRVGVRLENHNFHWAKADTLRALPAGEGRGLKVLQNPHGSLPRGGGVNARGGWRHVPGSRVWLAKYASGPSYQIMCDDATYVVGADGKSRLVSHSTNYALEEGRWSTKADSFKGSINIGTYRTLSEAQRKAASLRSQWRLGRGK